MERGVHVVRAIPARVGRRVGAHHVVVDQHVAEPELLHAEGIAADRAGVAPQLGLREHGPDPHGTLRTSPRDEERPTVPNYRSRFRLIAPAMAE